MRCLRMLGGGGADRVSGQDTGEELRSSQLHYASSHSIFRKAALVSITSNHVLLCKPTSPHHIVHEIQIDDIVSVGAALEPSTNAPSMLPETRVAANRVEKWPCLHILTYSRHETRPVKGQKWSPVDFALECESEMQCTDWCRLISRLIAERCGHRRPKNLRVYINPHGGKAEAPQKWNKVAGLFSAANINTEVIVTQRKNHARDDVMNGEYNTLAGFDGIVVVGGDGMLQELVDGLMRRPDKDQADAIHKRIRLGIIPAGSTDTVAFSLTGVHHAQTLALQIILGENCPLDIMHLTPDRGQDVYCSNFLGFGFYGEVIRRSEPLRWMGPGRYDFAGFNSFVSHKTWNVSVSFPNPKANSSSDEPQEWTKITDNFVCVNAMNMSCRCEKAPFGVVPQSKHDDGVLHLVLVYATSRAKFLSHLARIPMRSANQFDFEFIDTHQVAEFIVEPHGEGHFNADGELIESNRIHCRVLPSCVRLFARDTLRTVPTPYPH
eukprot:c45512_g1_i1.p1 GENE.c45512_g1_i1~~c45512_g1_i1.p1  ORF type:complete len:494 (+),score=99.97 c45512_g1_i1:2-1483(+)